MKKYFIVFIIGLIIGFGLMGWLAWTAMPKMMLSVHKSNLGFESTVMAIKEAAESKGWKVPKVYDIQKSLQGAGHSEMTRLKILSICQPDHAFTILSESDQNKKVSAIMPCRISVYETKDGVFIASMNSGLMGKMFGGTISSVMSKVSGEEKEMLKAIID